MFSLRVLRSISRKPPCLPRRIDLVGLVGVSLFFSASFFLRARKASCFSLFVAHSPEW